MKKNHRFSVVDKKEAGKDRLVIILSVISGLALVFCIITSMVYKGNGGTFLGAVGLAAALLALYGCILSFQTLFRKRRGSRVIYAGAILGGVLFILWMAIFLSGLKG